MREFCGACCEGNPIAVFTDDEYDYMCGVGTDLEQIFPVIPENSDEYLESDGQPDYQKIAAYYRTSMGELEEGSEEHNEAWGNWVSAQAIVLGAGRYRMTSVCANLNQETGACIDWDRRPVACREFTAGSADCYGFIEDSGINQMGTPVTINTSQPTTVGVLVGSARLH